MNHYNNTDLTISKSVLCLGKTFKSSKSFNIDWRVWGLPGALFCMSCTSFLQNFLLSGVGGYTLYSERSFSTPLRPLRMMERLKVERSMLNGRREKKWPILEDLFESSDQGSRLGW